jgi:hypothetical protein
MIFECVTRNRTFDLTAANQRHENDGASVRRDGGRPIKNFHDVPRLYDSQSFPLYSADQQ